MLILFLPASVEIQNAHMLIKCRHWPDIANKEIGSTARCTTNIIV